MHPVRLLFDLLPELLVEQRAFLRTSRAAAGSQMDQRQPGRGDRRAARYSGGPVSAVPLPYHPKLRKSVPERIESITGHCRDQTEAAGAEILSLSKADRHESFRI